MAGRARFGRTRDGAAAGARQPRRALDRLVGRDRGGAPGRPRAVLGDSQHRFGYELVPVPLTTAERDGFYAGFSNEIVWPLFHDLISLCQLRPVVLGGVRDRERAGSPTRSSRVAAPDDLVWVHDYHLMRVATALAARKASLRTAFFLHIPFPPLDVFLKLPWRFQVLHSLLDFDLVGFQTVRDRRNFVQCVRLLLPEVKVSGRGAVWTCGSGSASCASAPSRSRSTPPSSSGGRAGPRSRSSRRRSGSASRAASSSWGSTGSTTRRASRRNSRRSERSCAGIPRCRARSPSSRSSFRAARRFRGIRSTRRSSTVSSARSTASSRAGAGRRSDYVHRSLEGERLSAYYRAADVALVTPLKDGMNLVSKEYCASHIEGDGVLVLSEFAGSRGRAAGRGAARQPVRRRRGRRGAAHGADHARRRAPLPLAPPPAHGARARHLPVARHVPPGRGRPRARRLSPRGGLSAGGGAR